MGLEERMNNSLYAVSLVARAARECAKAVKLGPGIVFVRRKAHGQLLAGSVLPEMLHAAVPFVNGDMPVAQREKVAQDMRDGRTAVVVATACWSAGVDIPNLRWVMKLDMGKAPIRFLQDIGRGLRKHGGKEDLLVLLPRVSGKEDVKDRQATILDGQGIDHSLDKSCPMTSNGQDAAQPSDNAIIAQAASVAFSDGAYLAVFLVILCGVLRACGLYP